MSRPRPKFVRLHPADNPSTLNPVFFSHPDEFVPQIDETTGRIERWGIVDDDSTNADAVMYRIMSTQMMYGGHLGGLDLNKPEVQFVDALIARKERALQAGQAAAALMYKRDYIIDVDLALYQRDFRTSPRVWRRIRVSGGTSLEALQDKVLSPAMGWTRNYHGSVWTDHRDGAMFGDPESGAIDMMHVGMHYYAFVDQRPWHLADLLQEEGQHLSWTYDIGDKWRHMLTVVQILPEEESNGRVQVMDGAMACPPEDSKGLEGMGPRSYQFAICRSFWTSGPTPSGAPAATATKRWPRPQQRSTTGARPAASSPSASQWRQHSALWTLRWPAVPQSLPGPSSFACRCSPAAGRCGATRSAARRCAASRSLAEGSCRKQLPPERMLGPSHCAARAAARTTCKSARGASLFGTALKSVKRTPGACTSRSARRSRRGGRRSSGRPG